jgi:hypothetical protein
VGSGLTKADRAKLTSVFAWAQKRCGTAFHLTFEPFAATGEAAHTIFTCRRHDARQQEDALHFIVGVNRPALRNMSSQKLRRMAVHEIVHAILWPLTDFADQAAGDDGELLERIGAANETATYVLQRALVGDV